MDGKRHGEGCMTFADSKAIYVGQWNHGLRHGLGTLTLDAEGLHSYKGASIFLMILLFLMNH